ncbi:MAG: response regulator, partial [Sphaerospermopsis sp. SIO1G2]|nr:response regulator [Sphaerospermopsis sp. SIO1G2]
SCHLQYLKNMGVFASLSISLIHEQKLWGLIICHHYSPKTVNYETRKICKLIGQFSSTQLINHQEKELNIYRQQVRLIQTQINQNFTNELDDIGNIFKRHKTSLLNLVNASGAAILLQNKIICIGNTPSVPDTQELVNWVLEQKEKEIFHTDSLLKLYPPAKEFNHIASGILTISIVIHQHSYHIIWFRPEQIQTVNWAGNPSDSISIDENNYQDLTPRKSFALWKQTVKNKSLPWQEFEIEVAQEMRNSLMLFALEFSQLALQKAAEEAEEAETANRYKSQFLAKMSHELRTPLNAILGFAEILTRNSSLSTEEKEHLDIITRSGEHLLSLINDVLEMSKIEAGKLALNETYFDLHRLIFSLQEMFTIKASDKGLTLITEFSPDMDQYVFGDEGKLRQILINLIGNAIKFTVVGHIFIKVSYPQNTIFSKSAAGKIMVEFNVEDTGTGILEEDQELIFEAFLQAKSATQFMQGTGLGLSISRQFARLMGGDITVDSIVNQGTTFTCQVQLQIVDKLDVCTPVKNTKKVLSLAPGQPKYRILIVEDIVENRLLLERLLKSVGFDIYAVSNGLEAVKACQHWQPHLIWMDIQMPIMNGLEATKAIRATETGKNITIIALTASAFAEDRKEILQVGCDDVISKPFTENTLFSKLTEYLNISYVYVDRNHHHQKKNLRSNKLTSENLRIMPQKWINQVYEAAKIIDEQKLYELFIEIPQEHHQIADKLKKLVDNFQLETIMNLTDINNFQNYN